MAAGLDKIDQPQMVTTTPRTHILPLTMALLPSVLNLDSHLPSMSLFPQTKIPLAPHQSKGNLFLYQVI